MAKAKKATCENVLEWKGYFIDTMPYGAWALHEGRVANKQGKPGSGKNTSFYGSFEGAVKGLIDRRFRRAGGKAVHKDLASVLALLRQTAEEVHNACNG